MGRTSLTQRTPPSSPHRDPTMHPMAYMPRKVLDKHLSGRVGAMKVVNDGFQLVAGEGGIHSSSLNACRSEVFRFLVYSSSSQLR